MDKEEFKDMDQKKQKKMSLLGDENIQSNHKIEIPVQQQQA